MENEWDTFAFELITKYQLQKCVLHRYTSEMDIIRRLSKVEKIDETILKWLQGLPDVHPATDEKSNQYREGGNAIFKSKTNDHLALEAYSKAIFAAPEGSEALALGHANRAVLLIRFGRYREAFEDCELALAGRYPQSKRLKVCFRQAECAEQLNDGKLLDTIIENIASQEATTRLSVAEKAKLVQLRALQKVLNGHSSHAEGVLQEELIFPKLLEKQNQSVGRYVVTTETIEANSIITREKAVSFIPVYEPHPKSTIPSFDCQYCARVNVIPFPCATCGGACYCSIQCRTNHASIHRYECYGYRKHLWYHIGIAHLGMRCFLDGCAAIRTTDFNITDTLTDIGQIISPAEQDNSALGNYIGLFHLVTNFEKMDMADVLQYALVSFMLAVYLRDCTNFFSEMKSLSHNEKLVFVGTRVLHHVGQLVCNGHVISELRGTLPSEVNCYERNSLHINAGHLHRYFTSSRVFTGIFPRISLFNHSCDPNIRNHFEGSTLTVHATRTIDANEQIFNCYGPNCKIMTTKERKMYLRKQYCFDCNCSSCSANDDSGSEMYKLIKCPQAGCGKQFPKELRQQDLRDALNCMHCGEKINCAWFTTIVQIVQEGQDYTNHLFRICLRAYAEGCQILTKYNETKVHILAIIFDYFLQFAGIDPFCLSALKTLVYELIMLRRNQFGHMSLEYIVGCLYLLDLLAIERLVNDGRAVRVDVHCCKILTDFREALSIVGENTRSTVLHYLDKYVTLDGPE
ncbi:SET and MYND domain-containing protein 4-like [Anopheles coustani]|uniref:SET and MYND domain-containing protein 4-like n=2 Tax=coustani group TaxID=59130 RepID=UPI002659870D|nr:SET and MYND domain-containing protein 4-like [Anopheles coustani]